MAARQIKAHLDTSKEVERPIELVSITKVRPRTDNARTHSKKQIGQIAASINEFGWTVPLLVDERIVLLCGHGRWLAAQSLGLTEVPVIVVRGLSEAKKKALVLADNKIAANAGWDREILATVFSELEIELPEVGLPLELTGFDMPEIDELRLSFDEGATEAAETIPPLEKVTVSRLGDVWQLGHHRLACGDAREKDCLAELMDSERAAMLIADPPYNVRIASVQGRGKIKHREFAHASGEMSSPEFIKFHQDWMTPAAEVSSEGAIHMIFMDWKHLLETMTAANVVYSEQKNLIVWSKTNAGQGSFYRSQHELMLVYKVGTAPHQNHIQLGRNGRNRSNVWTYAGVNSFRAGRMEDLSAHPTAKPAMMIADAMRDCSRRGEVILDSFMGSGTTIIAAERVGRRAFGVEIDPLYVDVAVRRWQQLTKKDAILSGTGRTFSEVQAERASSRKR